MSTATFGIRLGAGGPDELITYSNSDWAGDPITLRSIGGYVGFLGTSILYWSSKTQRGIIALSSTESEFIQLALSVRQVLYVQPMFSDIGFGNIEQASIVDGDNLPAINSIGNDSAKSRTKHIDMRLKFCGEVLSANKLKIKYVPTAKNITTFSRSHYLLQDSENYGINSLQAFIFAERIRFI